MSHKLDFEKPIFELEEKIQGLRQFAEDNDLDLSAEVRKLEDKVSELRRETFSGLSAWDCVRLARHPGRPTTLDFIEGIFDDFIELKGDRAYSDDPAMVGGLAMLEGVPVTVLGHQKGRDTLENIRRNFGMPHPEGYRKALRLMQQAEKFGRPVVTFIDTAGAYCGLGAEERGQGHAIASNLIAMAGLKVPVISVVIGEGGSGGALGIGVADRVAMLSSAVYSVISPEGLSSILWKDATKASEAAAVMKMTARDIEALGVIDAIIEEPLGGAHRHQAQTVEAAGKWIKETLGDLRALPLETLLEKRYDKYRGMGQYEG